MTRIVARLLAPALLVVFALVSCGDETVDDLVLGGADPDAVEDDASDDGSSDDDATDESDDSSDDSSDDGKGGDSSDDLSDELDDFFTDEFSEDDVFTDGFLDGCGGSTQGGCGPFDPATDTAPSAGTPPPGPDGDLDDFWSACDAGDDEACDDLWINSPIASLYEAFATTCGGREPDNPFGGTCAAGGFTSDDSCGFEEQTGGCATFDGDYTSFDPTSAAPGPIANFDEMWAACGAGDLGECDDLWGGTPGGSVYEAYAASCGGRYDDGNLATRCETDG